MPAILDVCLQNFLEVQYMACRWASMIWTESSHGDLGLYHGLASRAGQNCDTVEAPPSNECAFTTGGVVIEDMTLEDEGIAIVVAVFFTPRTGENWGPSLRNPVTAAQIQPNFADYYQWLVTFTRRCMRDFHDAGRVYPDSLTMTDIALCTHDAYRRVGMVTPRQLLLIHPRVAAESLPEGCVMTRTFVIPVPDLPNQIGYIASMLLPYPHEVFDNIRG